VLPNNPLTATPTNDLLSAARAGEERALGDLLEGCRQYLLLIANEELDSRLRAKLGASDVVQQTFMEAQETFDHFSGNTDLALRAWLRKILQNNLTDSRRRYLLAEKRCLHRERSLDQYDSEHRLAYELPADASSPSSHFMHEEKVAQIRQVLDKLAANDREVLLLRHRDHLTFPQIGARMNRTSDAARMLWWRAFERLADLLEPLHDSLD